jgi:glycerol-3-phosphate acyltransferase PlsY
LPVLRQPELIGGPSGQLDARLTIVLAEVGAAGVVAALVAGYLLGSLPIALAVGRRHGVDLRLEGDRNPGYWNAKERLGSRAALPVLVGDTAKGVAAGLVGLVAAGDRHWWVAYLVVAAAMVGHAFPLFAGFRGGRSLLVFVGGSLVLSPIAAALAVALTAVVSLGRRSFAWGVRIGVFAYPFIQLAVEGPARVAATGCLMTIIGLRFLTAALSDRRDRWRRS